MRGVLKVERGTGCGKGYQEQDVKPGWQRCCVAKVDRVERVAGVARFTSAEGEKWPGRQGLPGWPQW